jgi:hypothetical protein
MSLAIYAAPFNEINDNNIINQKRQTHNKTQKKYNKEEFDTEKVNSVLQALHEKPYEESTNDLGNFEPLPKPESSGVQKTIATEQMVNRQTDYQTMGQAPQPNSEEEYLDLNNFNANYGDKKHVDEYYKKYVPDYTRPRNPNSNTYTNTNTTDSFQDDVLLQKLNYMIHLLEEKQDEKTNNVTEEIVLYSFLGIFIIFIVDSFARIGKYVR